MYYNDDTHDANDYESKSTKQPTLEKPSKSPSTLKSKSTKPEKTSKSTKQPKSNNEKSSKLPSSKSPSSKAPKSSKIPKGAPPPLPEGEGGQQQQVTSGGDGAFHNSMHAGLLSTIVRVMVATAFLWIKSW